MKALFFIFSFTICTTASSVTFTNNSNSEATIGIWPVHASDAPFLVVVGPGKTKSLSVIKYVQNLPEPRARPLISAVVRKKIDNNTITDETYCHPSGKPMSYFETHDKTIEIIYDGFGHCKTSGLE